MHFSIRTSTSTLIYVFLICAGGAWLVPTHLSYIVLFVLDSDGAWDTDACFQYALNVNVYLRWIGLYHTMSPDCVGRY